MGQVIPQSLRRRLVELCESGKSVAEASQILNIGYPGAAKLMRRYKEQGEVALEVGYSRCGRKSAYSAAIRLAITEALEDNNNLGAPIIRSRLLCEGKHEKVPHERTIQRWMRSGGQNLPRGRRPKQYGDYAKTPHETWQVDAKESVATADGIQHTYLSFTDEATSTFLKGCVFPPCHPDEASHPTSSQGGRGTGHAEQGNAFEDAV